MAETQIMQYVSKKMPAAWAMKSKSLNIDMETYTKRAIMSIYENEQLIKVAQTETGQRKIMMCITNAAIMGVQFGGQFPQCEIVGYEGKNGPEVWLNIRPAGYKHMVKNSTNPILKDFTIRAVFEGEEFSLDYANAEVKHTYDGKKEKGPLIGVYGIMIELSGEKEVKYMSRKEIENIRDGYSKGHTSGRSDVWKKSFDAMAIKTAAKKFLKPYAEEKEGRENALLLALDEERQNPDIEERMEDHLDGIIEADVIEQTEPAEPEPVIIEEEEEKPPEKNTPEEKKDEKQKDLF